MPTTPLTHHLVALWFADIAGYSDLAAEDERSALQLIEILQSLSRDTVRRYEGRVVKFMGDAVLAEFPSTELAVRAAAALSEQYAKKSAGTGRAQSEGRRSRAPDVAGPTAIFRGRGQWQRACRKRPNGRSSIKRRCLAPTPRSHGISVRVVGSSFVKGVGFDRPVPLL
jgi:class 3 adenylate cyclase